MKRLERLVTEGENKLEESSGEADWPQAGEG